MVTLGKCLILHMVMKWLVKLLEKVSAMNTLLILENIMNSKSPWFPAVGETLRLTRNFPFPETLSP